MCAAEDNALVTADRGAESGAPSAEVPGPRKSAWQRLVFDQRVAYLGAGTFNTAFAFGVFAVLEASLGRVVNYLLILLITHVIGVLEAFVLYRLMVFRVKGSLLLDLARFESVYLSALAMNAALLPLFVEVFGLPVILAQAVIVVIASLVSFFAHKHFSFRRPRGPVGE